MDEFICIHAENSAVVIFVVGKNLSLMIFVILDGYELR